MKGRFLTEKVLDQFKLNLISEEKSAATIEKYLRDATAFLGFIQNAEVTKEQAIAYKQ